MKLITNFISAFDQRLIKPLLITSCLLCSFYGYSQQSVSINNSGAPADSSAILDVSNTSKGLLIPRVSLTSINDITTIPSPAISLLVYNTNAAMSGGGVGFWYFNGSIWVQVLGTQGPAGPTGAQGLQGIQGPTGAQGLQGPTGVQGLQGAQGIQGLTGATGPTGSQGLQGIQGPTGQQGLQGIQGPTGAQGLQGPTGVQGLQGAQGIQGLTGTTGPTGSQGLQGIQGPTGQQGLQGIQGPTGAQGIQGPTGAQGLQGITGPSGVQGIQGNTGATGPLVSGTTGQTLRHDGTTWVANSKLYNNGTNIGIGTTSPAALLHTNGTGSGDGNILFTGSYKLSNAGPAPASGSGTRLMWYPDKAAFRVGHVFGLNWETDSIGWFSVAMGTDSKAKGMYATALGSFSNAFGNYSTSIGPNTYSSGDFSIAMGFQTTASGSYSTAMGYFTTAPSYDEYVIGSYNTIYAPLSQSAWNSTDRLFVIGNGTTEGARSNALTVLKNGNIGIGTSVPSSKLEVNGSIKITDGTQGTNKVLTSDANGLASWQSASAYVGPTGPTGPTGPAGAQGIQGPTGAQGTQGIQGNTGPTGLIGATGATGPLVSGTTGQTLRHDGTTWVANSKLYNDGTNIGIGTTSPSALLHANGTGTGEGNVLFTGSYKSISPGPAPASGAGTRLMWYPDKAAIRAGYTDGLFWDKDSIGNFSTAFGVNTKAKGNTSTALGNTTTASGDNSIAMGNNSNAKGNNSVSIGYFTNATGNFSTSFGSFTTASGPFSTAGGYNASASGYYSTALGYSPAASGSSSMALGYNTVSPSFCETAMGSCNTTYVPGSSTSWISGDRLFVIGNGTGSTSRSDALTILKNGNMGLGTSSPTSKLQVTGNGAFTGTVSGANAVDNDDFITKGQFLSSSLWDTAGQNIYNKNTGNVGIGTSAPTALLQTYGTGTGAGNVLFVGSYKSSGPGTAPASGLGTRMMWYPDKGAFRAGHIAASNPNCWDTDSIGNFSVAFGFNTKAKGIVATAMGDQTTATGNYSTAMGYGTIATGIASTAMGNNTTASDYYSTAMGNATTAYGQSSTAIGSHSFAEGVISTAIGNYAYAPSFCETVIGQYNFVGSTGNNGAWVSTDRLFVIGNGTSSTVRSNAMTILKNGNTGLGTDVPAALLHTSGTTTGGGNVLFEGSFKSSNPGAAPASGAGTRMMWYPDKAAFRAGYVDGAYWNTDSIGNFSAGFGYNTRAKGNYSTVSGYYCQAFGNYSVAMGDLAKAWGEGSTAFGSSSKASGTNATALGWAAMASGNYSFAAGYNPTALGTYSVALGWMAYANNLAGSAIGYGTTTFGQYATALGYQCTASGSTSVAIGNNTATTGNYSIAMGSFTTTPSAYEMVVGRYNTSYTPGSSTTWNTSDRLFVIGNGTGTTALSNAMTVMKNGKVGIGTDAPVEMLHVRNTSGTARIRIAAADSTLAEMNFFQDAIYKGAIGFDNTSENIYIYQAGNINFKNGRIGIQSVNNPNYAIELPNSTVIGTGSGRAYAWTTYSDERIKSDVKEINYGIDAVLKLKPVSYLQHNSTTENGKIVVDNAGVNNIGFIAQDIYKIIPEIVNKPKNEENTLWSMSYEKLVPVLTKAIQEQQGIIESQKSQIGKLEAQNSEIMKRLEALEQNYGVVWK